MLVQRWASVADEGILWTKDGGKNWQSIEKHRDGSVNMIDYAPANFNAPGYRFGSQQYVQDRQLIAFIPKNPRAVLTWGTNFLKGPLRSDDFGARFKPFAHGGNFKLVAQMSFGSHEGVWGQAVTEYGIRISENGGKSWRGHSEYNTPSLDHPTTTKDTFIQRSSWGFAFHPLHDHIMIATHSGSPTAVKRSEDSGATWETVGTYAGNGYLRENMVHWSKHDPQIVYAGRLRSNDGGTSFTSKLAHPITAISPHSAAIVISKESAGKWFISLNHGDSWTQLANPPGAPSGNTRVVHGGAHLGVAFDPSPAHDVSQERPLRLVDGGLEGVYEYTAPANNLGQGTWKHIPIKMNNDPYVKPLGNGQWLKFVVFDPRPGYHHCVYAFPGGQSTGRNRGDLFHRQAYYSNNSGRSWASLHSVKGDLSDFLSATAVQVSPHTGDVFVQDYSGQYQLMVEGPKGIKH